MGASWGPIRPSWPTLRFLEDAGYQRSEFEHERLAKAAEALEERAAERQRWAERRAEQNAADSASTDDSGDEEVDDQEPAGV